MLKQFLDRYFNILLLLVVLVNATGLFNDILEPDGILYANIAKTIAQSGNYWNLYADGVDWLDKPHLPFWLTAISFKLFGISSFGYKIPAFLCWLLGLRYLYKLAAFFYDNTIARLAVLIYGSALHVILSNFDVRAEPFLTAFIVMAMYFLSVGYFQNKLKYILLAAVAIAGAVMTKGIFVLITIGAGFFIYLVAAKKIKDIFHYRWLVLLVATTICIVPELYSLYVQFDLHPEKVVFGRTHVSGIRFFLWDSQFGRFFNTGPIKGKGDPFFFLHTTLWAFLPWAIIFVWAVVFSFKSWPKDKKVLVIGGSALLTFLLFSLSKFQLPHYIVVLFPHFAIITAVYLAGLKSDRSVVAWNYFQSFLLIVGAIAIATIGLTTGLGSKIYAWVPCSVLMLALAVFVKKKYLHSILLKGVGFSTGLFIFLNCCFYPNLLTYQAGMMAARTYNKLDKKAAPATYNIPSWSFVFYADSIPVSLPMEPGITQPKVVYTTAESLDSLQLRGYRYDVIGHFENFHVSMLTKNFLNPAKRSAVTDKHVLIKLYPRL